MQETSPRLCREFEMRFHTLIMLLVLFGSPIASIAADGPPAPSSDEIVSKMMLRSVQRQALLGQYSGMRLYILENERMHKRAKMLVRIKFEPTGAKHFEIVSEEGWEAANKHVLRKMLSSEEETSTPGQQNKTQLNFENYYFRIAGTEDIAGRPAYVLDVVPKRRDKYLIRGRIWVDAEDFAFVQAEGQPAKNPSFWTRSIRFTQLYSKHGQFWFAARTQSVTEALIFGRTNVTISYFGYDGKSDGIDNPAPEPGIEQERVSVGP
jgi:MucB/RseB N-terminal domain